VRQTTGIPLWGIDAPAERRRRWIATRGSGRTSPGLSDEVWVGLSKAQRGSLLLPAQRDAGVLDQHRRGKAGGLPAFKDRRGDIGGEIREAENLAVIGSVQALALGQIGKLGAPPCSSRLLNR